MPDYSPAKRIYKRSKDGSWAYRKLFNEATGEESWSAADSHTSALLSDLETATEEISLLKDKGSSEPAPGGAEIIPSGFEHSRANKREARRRRGGSNLRQTLHEENTSLKNFISSLEAENERLHNKSNRRRK
jgi:hypothetical protein